VVSNERVFGPVTKRSVHPASPTLLTRKGPLA